MSTLRSFRGILFDFDGTLARTMEDNFLAWKSACVEFGINLSPDDYFPLEGMKLSKIAEKYLLSAGKNSAQSEILVRKKEEAYRDLTREKRLELYPGAFELITTLHNENVPLAIVTSALRERMLGTVSKEFLGKFKTLVAGDDVTNGKPFPDPYLLAASRLNLDPGDCLAVENSPFGIQSAKFAGAQCIAVASTMSANFLAEADLVVESIASLDSLLKG